MNTFKEFIKRHFPSSISIYKEIKNKVRVMINNKPNEIVFRSIYQTNSWESAESISGPGSTLESTINFRDSFVKLLADYKANILLDAPCGDFNWLKELNLPVDKYVGVDIINELIDRNNKLFKTKNICFNKLDITTDKLPNSDIILCRDCLVHLSNNRILKAIRNFKKSGAKYLLTTTFNEINQNEDIVTGEWRKINLELRPFNFPDPIQLIYENCQTEDKNGKLSRDKYLGFWELNKIKL